MYLGHERSFVLTTCYLSTERRILQFLKAFTLQWMLASIHKHVNHIGYSTVNRFAFINMSLVFPSYFGKIPINIASLLFENSYRIISILNLNNSVSYCIAHFLPLGGVDRDFPFTEDETWRHFSYFSGTFRELCNKILFFIIWLGC